MASLKIPRAQFRSGDLNSDRAHKRQTLGLASVRRAAGSVSEIEQLETRCHLTAVTSLTLVDAVTGADLTTLTSGAVINLATLTNKTVNVRADADSSTESIEFALNGTVERVESGLPYALYSDVNGAYAGEVPDVGSYTIAATPYSKDSKGGTRGATYSVSISVIDQPVLTPVTQSVTGFTLYNADTNLPIGPLNNGDTINLGTLPTSRLTIKADTTSTIGSMVFGMDSITSFYTDAKSNYFLRGDNGKGDVYAWVPHAGNHTLTATPTSTDSSLVANYTASSIKFTIVDKTVIAPTVNIVTPTANSTKAGPAQYVVLANAADADGEVSKVEFYAGSTLIGMTTAEPYSVAWTDVTPGTYSLTAKAYDNNGNATISTPVSVTVKPFTTDYSFYVSPTGSDTNPGTVFAPFKTINRAAKAANKPGSTVWINPGTYRESVWLDYSGTSDKPITFKAVKPGSVILDGADLVSGWNRESGSTYTTTWNYDFFMNGKRTWGNTFGGTEYAEQFLVGNTPLKRVETAGDMSAGEFWIDYSNHSVHIWLPDSSDPNKTQILGSTRSRIFAPGKTKTGTAANIRVEGLIFQHASNFAQPQQAPVITDNGWVITDSTFRYINGTGLGVFGSDITLLRVVAENNGQAGIGGSFVNTALIKDSVTRYNNYRHVRVDWEGGGGKWTRSTNILMDNYSAYGNQGHGIWFDTENTNIAVTNSEVYNNVGVSKVDEGTGIFFEISPGPIRIEGNYVHNQSQAGIRIAESTNVTIQNNILIDQMRGVELRDMTGRVYTIDNVTIVNNQIRGWTESAIGTLQGTWNASTAVSKNILIENNTYDFTGVTATRMFRWGSTSYKTLSAWQAALAFDDTGAIATVLAPAA